MVSKLRASEFACCCELCPDTWRQQRRQQLHFHIFYLRTDAGLTSVPLVNQKFRGSAPFESWPPQLSRHGRGRATQWSVFFYVSVAKVGCVWQFATKEMFRQYPVLAQWVVSLLSASKITPGLARQLVGLCVQGSTRILADIQTYEVAEQAQRLYMYKEGVARTLQARERPFNWPPLVVAWFNTFTETRHRYQFLILDGASRMGKTCFARTLKPPDREALEINCAGGATPNLRQFDFFRHGVIIYDEVGPRQVLDNRKLFQSGDADVQLAASATNIHSYSVYVHGVRQVCCANRFAHEMRDLSQEDAAWIRANSVFILVEAPLFSE
jgi:hypothetical protein